MDGSIASFKAQGKMTLAHRAKRQAEGLVLLSSIEPIQIAFGLRRLRKQLDAGMVDAKGEDLVALAKAYVAVVEPLLRICQVPTAPKGQLAPNGSHAKPILPIA